MCLCEGRGPAGTIVHMVKLGIAATAWADIGAFWYDVVGSAQHPLGGALARNVLSKFTPEEPIRFLRRKEHIQKVEHFKEQLAWTHQRIQGKEGEREMRGDCRG